MIILIILYSMHLFYYIRSLHRAYPSLHPVGVIHWVPEQLNIKALTGACKVIDGCSLALYSATGSVVSSGICHRNKVNSTAWLYRDGPFHKIVSFTLHYIIHAVCILYIPGYFHPWSIGTCVKMNGTVYGNMVGQFFHSGYPFIAHAWWKISKRDYYGTNYKK